MLANPRYSFLRDISNRFGSENFYSWEKILTFAEK